MSAGSPAAIATRAVVFEGPARPLELRETSVRALADGEVLVRIRCCTLCRNDLNAWRGERAAAVPTILGHEILGEVEATAGQVRYWDSEREIRVGDRVTWSLTVSCERCFFCERGMPQKCERLFKYGHEIEVAGSELSGGLADHCLLRQGTAIVPVPEGLSDAVAAPASCATATAAAALRTAGDLSGQVVLVQGAGLLGLTASAWASKRGARVVVAEPDRLRRERSLRFGAVAAFDPERERGKLEHELTSATDGRGADVGFELTGQRAAVEQAPFLLRTGATYVLVGAVNPTGPCLEPETIVRRMLTVRGVHDYAPEDLGAALEFLGGEGSEFPFAEAVGAEFPLQRVEEAFRFASQRTALRVAVRPD